MLATEIDAARLSQVTTLAHGAHNECEGAMCAPTAAAHAEGKALAGHLYGAL